MGGVAVLRKGLISKVGGTAIVLTVGFLSYSNATGGNSDQYCRTKAGYIRLSTTGECRRSETHIDLPSADDYNALIARVDELAQAHSESGDTGELLNQVSSMQASISDLRNRNQQLSSVSETLTAKVNDLLRRLPNAIEVRRALLYPGVTLRNVNFGGLDMSGVNISGAELSNAVLTNAKLRGSILQGASFFESDLQHVDFSDVKANWLYIDSNTSLRNATLQRADLRNASIFSYDLSGTDFTDVDLRGASLGSYCYSNGGQGVCYGWSSPVSVEGADFSGAKLDGIVTSGLVGTPLALPDGWALQDGMLVQKS